MCVELTSLLFFGACSPCLAPHLRHLSPATVSLETTSDLVLSTTAVRQYLGPTSMDVEMAAIMVNQVQVRRLNTISYEIRSIVGLHCTRTLCRMSATLGVRQDRHPFMHLFLHSLQKSCSMRRSTMRRVPRQQYLHEGRPRASSSHAWADIYSGLSSVCCSPKLPNDCIAGLSNYTLESFKMQPKQTQEDVNGCHQVPQTSQKEVQKKGNPHAYHNLTPGLQHNM